MVLSSATQHAMSPEFVGKWGSQCLNTKFPLPTLLCAGNSVKLIFNRVISAACFALELLRVHIMCHLSYTIFSY